MKKYYHAWNLVFEGFPEYFIKLNKRFSNVREAWEKANTNILLQTGFTEKIATKYLEFKEQLDIDEEYNKVLEQGYRVLTIDKNSEYPALLKNLYQSIPPFILYYRGSFNKFNDIYDYSTIGIVGTRNMTGYGERIVKDIIRELALFKVVVISGLARGIDTMAHVEAVKAGIPTIAVLGFGINKTPWHLRNLVNDIYRNGIVVSEYPPDLPAKPIYFPLRNRIISGLSKGVIVVEAGEVSGALITAQMANNEGREVIAVPGSVYWGKSKGTNSLLKDQNAHALSSPKDLQSLLNLEKHDSANLKNLAFKRIKIKDKNHHIILNLLSENSYTKEELLDKAKISVSEFSQIITELELMNVIERNSKGLYALIDY